MQLNTICFCFIVLQCAIYGMCNDNVTFPKDIGLKIIKNYYLPDDAHAQYCELSLPTIPKSSSVSGDLDVLHLPSTAPVKFIEKDSHVELDVQLHFVNDIFRNDLPGIYYAIQSTSNSIQKTTFGFRGRDCGVSFYDWTKTSGSGLWAVVKECGKFLVFVCLDNPTGKKRIYNHEAGNYKTLCVHHNVPFLETSLMTEQYCDIFKTNEMMPCQIPFERYPFLFEMKNITKYEFIGNNTFIVLAKKQLYFAYIDDNTIIFKKQTIKEFVADEDGKEVLKEVGVIDFSANQDPLLVTPGKRVRFIALLTKSNLFCVEKSNLFCMDICQGLKSSGSLRKTIDLKGVNGCAHLNLISFYDNVVSFFPKKSYSIVSKVFEIELPQDWYYYHEIVDGTIPAKAYLRESYSWVHILCIQAHMRRLLTSKIIEKMLARKALAIENSVALINAHIRKLLAFDLLDRYKKEYDESRFFRFQKTIMKFYNCYLIHFVNFVLSKFRCLWFVP